jgi:thiamine-phosphate pyrophosphorylase
VTLRGLYAITPDDGGSGELLDKVAAALEGGISLLQYRRKKGSVAEARDIVKLARSRGVPVIVNDDVALALEVGADGAHLGREDGDVGAARKQLRGKILGVSCYNELALARTARDKGADYVAFGSVFSSPTKPSAVRAPISLFAQARSLGLPLAAIGGITLANAREVIDSGANLLAVISDLFDSPDIAARAAQYGKLFT